MNEEEVLEAGELLDEETREDNGWDVYEKTYQEQKNRNKALDCALVLAGMKENGKAVFPLLWDAEKIYEFLGGKTYKEIAPSE
jgi:hypothetical protein